MHSSMTSRLRQNSSEPSSSFGGAGSAIFAASVLAGDTSNINMGIGFVGVTLGAVLAGRVEPAAVAPYWLAQLIGGVAAGGVLWVIASGKEGFSAVESGFATNGYGDLSPDGYSLAAVLIAETVLTAIFLYIILGATDRRAPQGFAPVAIGLALTLIHLIHPDLNTSVNPARSSAWPSTQTRTSCRYGPSSSPHARYRHHSFTYVPLPDQSDHLMEDIRACRGRWRPTGRSPVRSAISGWKTAERAGDHLPRRRVEDLRSNGRP